MNPAAIMREPFDAEEHQQSRYLCEAAPFARLLVLSTMAPRA